MGLSVAAASLIGAGISAGTSIFSAISQKKTQKRAIEQQESSEKRALEQSKKLAKSQEEKQSELALTRRRDLQRRRGRRSGTGGRSGTLLTGPRGLSDSGSAGGGRKTLLGA